jgi:hypothetical protein
MGALESRALGIVQDNFTMRWKARGELEGIGWLEAWGNTLVEAMEALQAKAATVIAAKGQQKAEADAVEGDVAR